MATHLPGESHGQRSGNINQRNPKDEHAFQGKKDKNDGIQGPWETEDGYECLDEVRALFGE